VRVRRGEDARVALPAAPAITLEEVGAGRLALAGPGELIRQAPGDEILETIGSASCKSNGPVTTPFEEVQVDAFVAVLTVFAGVAGIVQTIVLLVERSERKRLERRGRPPSTYGTSSPWRPPSISESTADPGEAVDRPTEEPLPARYAGEQTHESDPTHQDFLGGRPPFDSHDFRASSRSSLAYLFGFIGALIYWKNASAKVRFHAAQSLWIDILAVIYAVIAMILTIIYLAISFPGPGPTQIPPGDPVMWAWILTTLVGPPIIHITFAILAIVGRDPRIPLVWKIAATVTARQEERLVSGQPSPPTHPQRRYEFLRSQRTATEDPGGASARESRSPSPSPVQFDGNNDECRPPFGGRPPLDPGDFAASWRSSLAYLLGFVGALMFWKNPSAKVRFHAAQSLWTGILAILYFIMGLILTGMYIALRYGDNQGQDIPASDPVVFLYLLTSLAGPPLIYLTCAILTIAGRNPRIPLVWKIAATASARWEERLGLR
jgi:uncharacterized membrane protein